MITQPRFLLSYENNKYNLYKKIHAAARETTMNNASQGQNPKNTTKAKRSRDCQNGISLGNVKWGGGKTKSR